MVLNFFLLILQINIFGPDSKLIYIKWLDRQSYLV